MPEINFKISLKPITLIFKIILTDYSEVREKNKMRKFSNGN